MKTNTKSTRSHVFAEARTAGGFGVHAAKQDAEAQLRRVTMACLLWEDLHYESGETTADAICRLIPQVDPQKCADIAIECRYDQKLRHVPLLIVREMVKYPEHRLLVAKTLTKVCKRPDETAEFLRLYWGTDDKRTSKNKPLPSQVKRGLAAAFGRYDAYQLAKWRLQDQGIKLRDVLLLCRPKPETKERAVLYKQLIENTLPTPETWEVGYSRAKSVEEKRAVWQHLLENNSLGATALLKNLRNMEEVKVPKSVIATGLKNAYTEFLVPVDFLKARKHAPNFTRELEDMMYRCTAQWPKLTGYTAFVVDVSGSMQCARISDKSDFTRLDVAIAMTVLASEMCERVGIYATAGNDSTRVHQTAKVEPLRGFALADKIMNYYSRLGGGGIFTRQVCDYVRKEEDEQPDRLIIFSDSADCDLPGSRTPKPCGKRNYIVDVSAHRHGVAYDGIWTAEVSGWSEKFLAFIAAMEKPMN